MKWLPRALAAAIAVAVIIWFFARSTESEVAVAVAETGTALDSATGTCLVFAAADANIETTRNAELETLDVALGQKVAAGDVVARQRDFELAITFEQTRIRLEAARKRRDIENAISFDIENLRDQLEGTRLAYELQQVSESVLVQQERELEKRLSQSAYESVYEVETVEFLEAEMRRLENQMAQLELRAPFDGTIVELTAFPGQFLYGRSKVARVIGKQRIFEITLSEEDSANVREGQPVRVRLAGLPDRTFSAQVSRIDAFADRNTKTRKVFVDIDEPDPALVPGLTGEAVIYKSERADAVLIPRQALIGDRVYVVKGGRVEVRQVVPGFLSLRNAEIRSGVAAGELVMVSGFDRVSDGSRVRPRK